MARKGRNLQTSAQKEIAKLIGSLGGRHSAWEIWQDFIVMTATCFANSLGGPCKEEREELYCSRAQKYSTDELNVFAKMVAILVNEVELEPDQDFLGELFMSLNLGDEWKGQFFTPYNVSRMMSAMIFGDGIRKEIEERGWISVNDPACGAGALLLAFAGECRRQDVNYQRSVLFVAQDIDFLAGMMCYIQLSLQGCAGYVKIGNSLTDPVTGIGDSPLIPLEGPDVWFTPMYYSEVWQGRRLIEGLRRKLSGAMELEAQPSANQ